jgi:hypothetical protein
MFRPLRVLSAFAAAAALLRGQAAAQIAEASPAITAQEVARHAGAIAHDSMLGRDTPSPGLERTARYVAEQFQELGLRSYRAHLLRTPGQQASLISRYRVPLLLDAAQSRVVFTVGAQKAVAGFATAAYLWRPYVPAQPNAASVVLVTGLHTVASMRGSKDKLTGKTILYVTPAGVDSAAQRTISALYDAAYAGNSGRRDALVILGAEDSATFVQSLRAAQPFVERPSFMSSLWPQWSVYVRPEAAESLMALLAAAGVDLTQARADTPPRVRELPSVAIAFEPRQAISTDTATAPNVLGILEGSDSVLKREHIFIVAHMDHHGATRGQADRMPNGADDNAFGTAGLIALAKAFSQPGARPRRSLIFLAASGGVKTGRWGSEAAASKTNLRGREGAIDPPLVVAALNIDKVGGASDSIRIDGLGDVELATRLDWISASHPELQWTVVGGGTLLRSRSDGFAFARYGIPSLSFSTGRPDDARSADPPPPVNAEQAVRALRFVYYAGQEIANAKQPPRWNAEGRRRFLKGQKPN